MSASELKPFQYAILRAMPRVDRGEFINIGAVLYCQAHDFLAAELAMSEQRLVNLDPSADVALVQAAAEAVVRSCAAPTGTARENDGLATRFGMVTAPRSAVIQPSAVHAGMTSDPATTLQQLINRYVR